MENAPAENNRRILTLVQVAMIAAVGVYAILYGFLRSRIGSPAPSASRPAEWALMTVGVGQYLAATVLGHRLLRSRRRAAIDRVGSFFLVRFAAAEAIAIFGFALGLTGSGPRWVLAFLALALIALLLATPTRDAHAQALAQAEQSEP